MAILIEGMEMPKDGVYWCEIGVAGDIATITIHGEERKSFPLVPVPEPHGDLIDASEKIRVQMYDDEHEDFHMVEMTIDDLLSQSWVKAYAFPVIPASEAGEA